MLRFVHSLPGLLAALLVTVLAVTGAILAFEPVIDRAGAVIPGAGQISVASVAAKATATRKDVERIVRTASGSVIVYHSENGLPRADRIDPETGASLAPHSPSPFMQTVTNLHRSLLLGNSGRAGAGVGALLMVVLAISGALMLAQRAGGWSAILKPIKGTAAQRRHAGLARLAVLGLLLSGLTGGYLSLATFEFVSDGMAVEAPAQVEANGGPRLPVARLKALQAVDINDLRELTVPNAKDQADAYGLTTAHGIGQVDAATGEMLAYEPHNTARQVYETVYMLHSGKGLWQLALFLGLCAATVPVLSVTGFMLWLRRSKSTPRIKGNIAAQSADTIILVGSEGGATWGFAATLHAALRKAGHSVHVAPMNNMADTYAKAERILFLASTYGDGSAPSSANRFLANLARSRVSAPYAVLGFGDRAYPKFCRFAEAIETALRARGLPALLPLGRIDRQSTQDFARWGADLGAAIGTPLVLDHTVAPPETIRLSLIERTDYGVDVQAPTTVFRFVVPPKLQTAGFMQRLFKRSPKLPSFTAGDLVGILAPGTNVPRFYSLASSSDDGVLEICVRKQPGGLCSSYLHSLSAGGTIDAFIKANPTFRPMRGKAPLILIGAGAGIGPLVGIIRQNTKRRPVHLYWGGRHPGSDFLYEGDLSFYLSDGRLTRFRTAFSRLVQRHYVQDRVAIEANVMRDLIKSGAQVMICGGREMAANVASVIDGIVRPIGLDLAQLKAEGRYVEDVY